MMMNNSSWEKYLRKEHQDFYNALMRQKAVCCQQRIFVNDKGYYETPKKKYEVSVKEEETWLIFHPRTKSGKRVHIRNMKKDYRKCIRSYASFLRAEGMNNKDEMLYYILHYTYYHISFYRGINITYDSTRPIIVEVINWVMSKDIDKIDKSKFIDKRKTAAPNEICNGGAIRKARKSEKISLTRQSNKLITDEKIAELYNPDLTITENCNAIGIKPTRLKQWKKEHADKVESIEDKINRLYNPDLGWKKNAEIIGCSVNTIKKYVKKNEPLSVEVEKEKIKTEDTENQFDEKIDFEGKIDLENDDFCMWFLGEDFMNEVNRQREQNKRLFG
jgi:hypothetical protein